MVQTYIERMLKNREGGILVTVEILTDKKNSEGILLPTQKKKKNHYHQEIRKEEHFLCFRYNFVLKNTCTEHKKTTIQKTGLNQLLQVR